MNNKPAYILGALGEIEEDFKYALISDYTTIGDFDLTPQEINQTSELLGTPLDNHSQLVHIAQELSPLQKRYISTPIKQRISIKAIYFLDFNTPYC